MTHKFFQKSESEQKKLLLFAGLILLLVCGSIAVIAYLSGFYVLGGLIPVFLLIAAPFFDLPAGRKKGSFIYYSPFFITEPKKDGTVIFHGGTLFDYVYTIRPELRGNARTKFVLYGYILGLIRFISEHEDQENSNLKVRGTSYIITRRTASRFGLKPVQKDFLQMVVLFFNYIPITLSNSFLKQKLSFPKFSNIQTFEGTFDQLCARKGELLRLKRQLKPT